MKRFLKINENDNVIVALDDFDKGDKVEIDSIEIEVKENISFGHKIAISDIKKGDDVYKYGLSIGRAMHNIESGQHVHSHNLKSNRG